MQIPEGDKLLSPNAGKWIARIRGRIVAQEETADRASQAAHQSHPGDVPEISFVPFPELPFGLRWVSSVLESLPPGQVIHLVGGAVRDVLLGRDTHDLDFVVPTDGIKTARRVSIALQGAFFPLDKDNDIGRVVLLHDDSTRDLLDFSSYRGPSLESDLRGRDFSINALAFNLHSRQFVDPLGGWQDLRSGLIRACSEHSIIEDPVRILRAVRLAALLGFGIQDGTRQLLKESVQRLSEITPERIRDELFRILEGPQPSTAIRALDILGALPYVLPEILDLKDVTQPPPHLYDAWEHSLSAVDHLDSILTQLCGVQSEEAGNDLYSGLLALKLGRYRERFKQHLAAHPGSERTPRALLIFAALYHDIAKPRMKAVENGQIHFHRHDEQGALLAVERSKQLRLSNAEQDRVRIIVQNHMRLVSHVHLLEEAGKPPTRRAIYRFFRDTREAGVDLCLLALADLRATYGTRITQETWTACLDVVRLFLENWWEKRDETIDPPLFVNGDDLIGTLKLQPGPDIGRILEAVREAQALGSIHSREEALILARDWVSAHSANEPPGKGC